MEKVTGTIASLGNDAPLLAGGRTGPPDRREISARWLSGTFLTGLTSSVLMGVALFAALGREQLATPPEIAALGERSDSSESGARAKTARLAPPQIAPKAKDRRRMEVSTMLREGDRDVVRTQPFVHVKMALAAAHNTTREYPPFNPLDVFADDKSVQTAKTGLIYGAKVESEVSLRTIDFPIGSVDFDEESALTAAEVENVVRSTGAVLTEGDVQVAALHYVDPQRFGKNVASGVVPAPSSGVRIIQENVSVAHGIRRSAQLTRFSEDIIPFNKSRKIRAAFADSGYDADDAKGMAEALEKLLNTRALKKGTVLRVGLESKGEEERIVRSSVYRGNDHLLTIAIDDRDQYVPADAPEPSTAVETAFDDTPPPVRVRKNLPSAYNAIYRAAYSYGMSQAMTKQLVKLLAADVDFKSRISPTDRLEVFFSQPGEDDTISEESEVLYVKASFGGTARTLYRYATKDGTIDYFDENGRSAKQFLIRNPLPNGRFRSGFGMRRHPILKYRKMHTGVDWAAPRGTPIIASGNGRVVKAGWSGGYGRQTIIRHSNGYTTSYSHQSRIARGIAPGARVRQGQVIGYVGSTGLSTGNHLHYELIVNGRKVDPMRVRLPTGKVLKGKELQSFKREIARIDKLLIDQEDGSPLKVASR